MPATRALAPSAPIAAAATSAMPVSRVAGPAQAGTAPPPEAGVTLVPATTTAKTMPAPAAPQAASTARRRSARSRAASAASTTPAESHTGGTPEPPGLTRTRPRAVAGWPLGPGRPASSSSRDGCASTSSDHGASTSTGIPRITRTRRPSSRSAWAPEPNAPPRTTAVTSTARPSGRASAQASGTKAVTRVSSRTVIQVLRQPGRAPLAAVSARMPRPTVMAAARASGGSRTARTAVPIRPCARAPVAAGSRA